MIGASEKTAQNAIEDANLATLSSLKALQVARTVRKTSRANPTPVQASSNPPHHIPASGPHGTAAGREQVLHVYQYSPARPRPFSQRGIALRVIRLILTVVAAVFIVPRLVTMIRSLIHDVGRYNGMRAMSNEKPLIHEVREMASDITANESTALKGVAESIESLPADAARYIKMKVDVAPISTRARALTPQLQVSRALPTRRD